jgi:hypothetical protein
MAYSITSANPDIGCWNLYQFVHCLLPGRRHCSSFARRAYDRQFGGRHV